MSAGEPKDEEQLSKLTIKIPADLRRVIEERAKFNLRTPQAEIVVCLKNNYKIPKEKKPVGRPKLPVSEVPPHVLAELKSLEKGGHVRKHSNGQYVGVYPKGTGWAATVPNRAVGRGQKYLGLYRTKEEAILERAREDKLHFDMSMEEARMMEQWTYETHASWPQDPLLEEKDIPVVKLTKEDEKGFAELMAPPKTFEELAPEFQVEKPNLNNPMDFEWPVDPNPPDPEDLV